MKKIIKKVFSKSSLKKLFKYLLIVVPIGAFIGIICVLANSCHPVENNKKQAINLTQLRNSTTYNFVSTDFNSPDYWECFYISNGYVENDVYMIDINSWYYNISIGSDNYTYYLEGLRNQYNDYFSAYEIYFYLKSNDEWYTSIFVRYNSSSVLSLLIYDDDARSYSITISSGAIVFGDTTTISNNLDAYYYSGGDTSSEEPVTSELVTSEPVTSELLSSTIDSSSEIVLNTNILISSACNFNNLISDDYQKYEFPNLYLWPGHTGDYSLSLGDISFKVLNNNKVYNRITINYKNITSSDYVGYVNSNITLIPNYYGDWQYIGLQKPYDLRSVTDRNNLYYINNIYYERYENNNIIDSLKVFEGTKSYSGYLVESDNQLSNTLVSGFKVVANGWLDSDYRRLEVITDNNHLLNVPNTRINNYTEQEFLTNNFVYIAGDNGEGFNSVFSLITGAFGSIAPILNLMILPNITIGMLLLVPLLIGIMLAIIKLIKK